MKNKTTDKASDVYRIASAQFVVQMESNGGVNSEEFAALIAALIATEPKLRPVGSPELRTHEGLTELQLDVEYGPPGLVAIAEASVKAALLRMLEGRTDITASEVWDLNHRVATRAELQAHHDSLRDRSRDMSIPLTIRKELANQANALRKHLGQ